MTTIQSPYQFTQTQDWFSHNQEKWKSMFPLVTSQEPRALEIGSWEGRSAVFLLTELCKEKGEVVCIDHFDLMTSEAGVERRRKLELNLTLTGGKFRVIADFSVPALMIVLSEEMSSNNAGFDWIYVDGSHEADDTFLDGELSWRLARKGCIVIFDDYHWDKEPEDSIHHPKRGIDAFLKLHEGEYELLSNLEVDYQVVLRKTNNMRIGFLTAASGEGADHNDFGYGIHIAIVADTRYAIGAAVTIRSAIEHTPGRITFYIVDCGLTSKDQAMLRASIPDEARVTMKFLDLPAQSLSQQIGTVWAKIDMIRILPVERVLYLDADTLIRASLQDIWDTDMAEAPIAAVSDVGFPMGHDEVTMRAYFNGGVLLIDLAKVRSGFDQMHEMALKMKDSKFRDQDMLNTYFPTWKNLSLRWNAQGLGTYAKYPSPGRDSLDEMADPAIVHFTGPIYPAVKVVINPYVQPPTAKPWGYLGGKGHPFGEEWWAMLEKTSWKGTRESQEWKAQNAVAIEQALSTAAAEFQIAMYL